MDKRVEKRLMTRAMESYDRDPFAFEFKDELSLFDIVRGGLTEMIPSVLDKGMDSYREVDAYVTYSDDPIRNEIYKFVNAVTLFSRAAIAGGVPDVVAYGIAESYIYCADKYQQIYFMDALMTFTERVAEYKSKDRTYGSITQAIKRYVFDHISEPLRIRDIAEALYLSESHCSHVFKQVEGITIRQYIEKCRITSSCSMLLHSNMSIQAISEHFCFSRHSYYSEVFKREMGMTPSEYRMCQGDVSPDTFVSEE